MNKTIIIRILFFHGKYLVEENNVAFVYRQYKTSEKKETLFVCVGLL